MTADSTKLNDDHVQTVHAHAFSPYAYVLGDSVIHALWEPINNALHLVFTKPGLQ